MTIIRKRKIIANSDNIYFVDFDNESALFCITREEFEKNQEILNEIMYRNKPIDIPKTKTVKV